MLSTEASSAGPRRQSAATATTPSSSTIATSTVLRRDRSTKQSAALSATIPTAAAYSRQTGVGSARGAGGGGGGGGGGGRGEGRDGTSRRSAGAASGFHQALPGGVAEGRGRSTIAPMGIHSP